MENKLKIKVAFLLIAIVMLIAIGFSLISHVPVNQNNTTIPDNQTSNHTQIANPASVYCEEHGGELIIANCGAVGSRSEGWYSRNGDLIKYDNCGVEGNQAGFCKIGDKTCDEWAYFRGECQL